MYGKCWRGCVGVQLVFNSVLTSIGCSEVSDGTGLNSDLTGEGDNSSVMSISRSISSISDALLVSSSL